MVILCVLKTIILYSYNRIVECSCSLTKYNSVGLHLAYLLKPPPSTFRLLKNSVALLIDMRLNICLFCRCFTVTCMWPMLLNLFLGMYLKKMRWGMSCSNPDVHLYTVIFESSVLSENLSGKISGATQTAVSCSETIKY